MKNRNIKKLFIGGVATDYCVGKTALDAKQLDYDVYLIQEAIKGVADATTKEMLDILIAKGVKTIDIDTFKTIISQDFSPEELTD